MKEIREKALRLRPDERASLAHELIASLEDAERFDLSREYEQEIQRRLAEVLAGRAKSRPASDVFADIEARFA